MSNLRISNDFEDMKEIYNTLSDKEKFFITGKSDLQVFPFIDRFIVYKNDLPIAFVESFAYDGMSKTFASVIIAVRKGYERKHYGKMLMEKCMMSLKKKGYRRIIYSVDKNNIASQKLAESLNFTLIKQWKTPEGKFYYKKLEED